MQISWSSILFNGVFVWAVGSALFSIALFSIRPTRLKTYEKVKVELASEAANTSTSKTALKEEPFKPAQTAAYQTEAADASLQHIISSDATKAGPHATDGASSTDAQVRCCWDAYRTKHLSDFCDYHTHCSTLKMCCLSKMTSWNFDIPCIWVACMTLLCGSVAQLTIHCIFLHRLYERHFAPCHRYHLGLVAVYETQPV